MSLGWAARRADPKPFVIVGVEPSGMTEIKNSYTPGDLGFDPLCLLSGEGPVPAALPNVGDKEALQLAELKHGRAAMLAITGFAAQEFLWRSPVVAQTPWFFGR